MGARGSPYRVSSRDEPGPAEPRAPLDVTTFGILLFVMACSLVRFGLFAFRPERLGLDPALALAASAASAYYLVRLFWR